MLDTGSSARLQATWYLLMTPFGSSGASHTMVTELSETSGNQMLTGGPGAERGLETQRIEKHLRIIRTEPFVVLSPSVPYMT